MENKNIVICENCGAEMDIHDPECPFCGHINITGAEEKYINDMQGIKARLADVDDEVDKQTAQKVKTTVVIVICTVIALIVVIAIVFLVYNFKNRSDSYTKQGGLTYITDPVEEAKWKQDNQGRLDDLYEAGDFDALYDEYEQLIISGNMGSFLGWEHSFLVIQLSTFKSYYDIMESGREVDDFEIHQIMFNALYYYNGDYKRTLISSKDMGILEEHGDEYLKKVYKRFGFDESVFKDMQHECLMDSGDVSPMDTDKYCDNHKELFK